MKKIKNNETIINLKKSWKYVRNQKKKFFLFLFFSFLLSIVGIIPPLISAKILINMTDGLFDKLAFFALLLLIITITKHICRYLCMIISDKFLKTTVAELQVELAKETLKLEVKELDKKSSGIFIDRLNNDTNDIVAIFIDIGDRLNDVISNLGLFVAIFVINKILFCYLVLTSILLFILEKKRMKIWFESDRNRRKLSEKNTGLIGELVRGLRDIKLLNINKSFVNKTEQKLIEVNQEKFRMNKIKYQYRLLIDGLDALFKFTFIILGIVLIKNSLLTIANFLVIYMYQGNISGILTYISSLFELVKNYNVSAGRVFEVIDNTFKKEEFGDKHLEKIKGDFEFRKVDFSYEENRKILNNLSFKVKANQTVAFVGKSGAGKTTIFSLISKLYNIDSGEILIDNININDLDCDTIRNNMSVISQSPYIFNFSIKDNLKLVKPNMTNEEMIETCKLARIHDYIMTLPNKYDTVVGEGGVILSGGQRQRLAIARALLKKTEIILFDEATSSLDNETQHEIQEAINHLKGTYTIMIIAHRLSTVINSDKIYVLDKGKIVGEGTHKELMKNNKIYRRLYKYELID